MIPYVNKLDSSCYFHILQLRAIRRSLTVDAAHALAQSLIHSRLDYCNSVLVGLPEYMINCLQSVLWSAARLVLQLPMRSHALERMQVELHWLAYPHRLFYKVGVISNKCLHGLASPYSVSPIHKGVWHWWALPLKVCNRWTAGRTSH